jgi:hypothetical protein
VLLVEFNAHHRQGDSSIGTHQAGGAREDSWFWSLTGNRNVLVSRDGIACSGKSGRFNSKVDKWAGGSSLDLLLKEWIKKIDPESMWLGPRS